MQMDFFKILPYALPSEDGKPIDVRLIKQKCSSGLDECPPEDRAIAWLILTCVHPTDPVQWPAMRDGLVAQYKEWVKMLSLSEYQTKILPNTNEITEFGLPNNSTMELIHGDVIRSPHHIIFFPNPTQKDQSTTEILDCYQPHMRRIERILYIFSQMNPGLGYVQGFHELVCPLFFTLLSAQQMFNGNWDEIEALSYFMLQNLINRTLLNELYTAADGSALIYRNVANFTALLGVHLPKCLRTIESLNIHPMVFAYRWLNLLFAQEHLMPDLVIIWDAILAHFEDLLGYTMYVAVAHVKMVEAEIDPEDPIRVLNALKNVHVDDIRSLLIYARQIYTSDHLPHKEAGFSLFGHFRK